MDGATQEKLQKQFNYLISQIKPEKDKKYQAQISYMMKLLKDKCVVIDDQKREKAKMQEQIGYLTKIVTQKCQVVEDHKKEKTKMMT